MNSSEFGSTLVFRNSIDHRTHNWRGYSIYKLAGSRNEEHFSLPWLFPHERGKSINLTVKTQQDWNGTQHSSNSLQYVVTKTINNLLPSYSYILTATAITLPLFFLKTFHESRLLAMFILPTHPSSRFSKTHLQISVVEHSVIWAHEHIPENPALSCTSLVI